jgi:hypothetical protein
MYRRILVVSILVLLLSSLSATPVSASEVSSSPVFTTLLQGFLKWSQKTLSISQNVPTTSSEAGPTVNPNSEDKGATIDPDGLVILPDAGPTLEPDELSGDNGPTVDPNG